MDKQREVRGIITVEEAIQARKDGVKILSDMDLQMPYTVNQDEPVSEILNTIGESKVPLAVVNEKKRLMGILVKGNVLSALAPDNNGGENDE